MYMAEVLELSIDDEQMHEPLVNRREAMKRDAW